MSFRRIAVLLLCAPLAGCGGDDPPPDRTGCSVADQTGCELGLVCEEVQGGEPACFEPLSVQGRVFDALTDTGIAGARVIARDANDAAVSRVAISKEDGTYALVVPTPRDANGAPLEKDVTLRADAMGYDTFPKAPRVAIPIDLSDAAGAPPVLVSAATDIALIPLDNVTGLGMISGIVDAENPGGTLVVAGAVTGAADFGGQYTIFNVPAGDVVVSGYGAGLQLDTANATVTAGQETPNVDLHQIGDATAVVSGNIQIVNAPGGSETSVILVVESTFNETAARGEAPRGLRVGNVSGDFSIPDVPDGRYVVLAAFENDGLVRDPDTSIGGTEIVHIEVSDADVAISEGFKVTEALAVTSPGANEIETVSGTPTFVWADDSSEDIYELRVFDALGNLTFENLAVPGQSGGDTVSYTYDGPALEPGMIYQFRVISVKDMVPISATEDLRGVFLYE